MATERLSSTDTSALDDQLLLQRIQEGDSTAVSDLHDLYWEPLLAYLTRILDWESADCVEDLAQEALINLWRRRHLCHGSLRGYLFRTARNLAFNWRRDNRVHQRSLSQLSWEAPIVEPPTPADLLVERELSHAIDGFVASLPTRRREVFLHVRIRGLSYRDTAKLLGISPRTVANQMSTALTELRRQLEPHLTGHLRRA